MPGDTREESPTSASTASPAHARKVEPSSGLFRRGKYVAGCILPFPHVPLHVAQVLRVNGFHVKGTNICFLPENTQITLDSFPDISASTTYTHSNRECNENEAVTVISCPDAWVGVKPPKKGKKHAAGDHVAYDRKKEAIQRARRGKTGDPRKRRGGRSQRRKGKHATVSSMRNLWRKNVKNALIGEGVHLPRALRDACISVAGMGEGMSVQGYADCVGRVFKGCTHGQDNTNSNATCSALNV